LRADLPGSVGAALRVPSAPLFLTLAEAASQVDAGRFPPSSNTLLDAAYRRTRVAKPDLASTVESGVSLMPEGILEKFNAAQVRDLFAYLESDAPKQ